MTAFGPGTLIADDYEIKQLLASGGMDDVYLAMQRSMSRLVVIKVLRDSASADEAKRFTKEGRLAGNLRHPNIVVTHGAGEFRHNGTSYRYIAMEHVAGTTLHDWLATGPPRLARVKVLLQVADALAYAHQRSVVHRDLKPKNILVSDRGHATIVDFGVAALVDPDIFFHADVTIPRAMQPSGGTFAGTPGYMPPEQIRAERADERSDVFSFGCVLYEAVHERRAFDSAYAVLNRNPPNPIPAGFFDAEPLRRLIDECLRKKATKRPTSQEVAAMLRAFVHAEEREASRVGKQTTQRRAGARVPRRVLPIAIALVAMIAIAIALWQWPKRAPAMAPPAESPTPSSAVAAAIEPLTIDGAPFAVAISPDGTQLAYAMQVENGNEVRVRDIASGAERHLALLPVAGALSLTWSNDDATIYVRSQNGTSSALSRLSATAAGAPVPIVSVLHSDVTTSPDGTQLAFIRFDAARRETSLLITDRVASTERALVTNGNVLDAPVWSPDGQTIAFVSNRQIGAARVDGTPMASVPQLPGEEVVELRWVGDSSLLARTRARDTSQKSAAWLLAFPSGSIRRISLDARHWSEIECATRAAGACFAVGRVGTNSVWVGRIDDAENLRNVRTVHTADGVAEVAWSAGGRLLWMSNETGTYEVWSMNPDGSDARPITSAAANMTNARLGPRGTHVYYGDMIGITRVAIDGFGEERLFPHPGLIAAISSDERTFVLMNHDGKTFLIASTDGSRSTVPGAIPVEGVFFSRDDRSLYAAMNLGAPTMRWGLFRHRRDGSGRARIPPEFAWRPTVSPRRDLLAFHGFDQTAGKTFLGVSRFPSGEILVKNYAAAERLMRIGWLPSQSGIVYADTVNLFLQRVDGSPAKTLTAFTNGLINGFAISPDGERIAAFRSLQRNGIERLTFAHR